MEVSGVEEERDRQHTRRVNESRHRALQRVSFTSSKRNPSLIVTMKP